MQRGDNVKVRRVSRVPTMLWDKKGKVTNIRQDWASVDIDGVIYSFKKDELKNA